MRAPTVSREDDDGEDDASSRDASARDASARDERASTRARGRASTSLSRRDARRACPQRLCVRRPRASSISSQHGESPRPKSDATRATNTDARDQDSCPGGHLPFFVFLFFVYLL